MGENSKIETARDPDEFVDECDFSPTGYAIWRRGEKEGVVDYCTCRPAPAPAISPSIDDLLIENGERFLDEMAASSPSRTEP